jgi:hypothetical protein
MASKVVPVALTISRIARADEVLGVTRLASKAPEARESATKFC